MLQKIHKYAYVKLRTYIVCHKKKHTILLPQVKSRSFQLVHRK